MTVVMHTSGIDNIIYATGKVAVIIVYILLGVRNVVDYYDLTLSGLVKLLINKC